jgi:hypothetical protein
MTQLKMPPGKPVRFISTIKRSSGHDRCCGWPSVSKIQMIRNHLMIFACVLAMSPAFAQASTEEDGVAVFFNLCGGTVAAVETPFDPSAFKFTKLGPDVLKKIRPTEEGPFWDVQSSRSDLRGLVHIWTNGNCTFELVKANERATREAYDHQLANFALEIGGIVERRPDKVTLMEGTNDFQRMARHRARQSLSPGPNDISQNEVHDPTHDAYAQSPLTTQIGSSPPTPPFPSSTR